MIDHDLADAGIAGNPRVQFDAARVRASTIRELRELEPLTNDGLDNTEVIRRSMAHVQFGPINSPARVSDQRETRAGIFTFLIST